MCQMDLYVVDVVFWIVVVVVDMKVGFFVFFYDQDWMDYYKDVVMCIGQFVYDGVEQEWYVVIGDGKY